MRRSVVITRRVIVEAETLEDVQGFAWTLERRVADVGCEAEGVKTLSRQTTSRIEEIDDAQKHPLQDTIKTLERLCDTLAHVPPESWGESPESVLVDVVDDLRALLSWSGPDLGSDAYRAFYSDVQDLTLKFLYGAVQCRHREFPVDDNGRGWESLSCEASDGLIKILDRHRPEVNAWLDKRRGV